MTDYNRKMLEALAEEYEGYAQAQALRSLLSESEWSVAERHWSIELSARLKHAINRIESIAETHPELSLEDDLKHLRDVPLCGPPHGYVTPEYLSAATRANERERIAGIMDAVSVESTRRVNAWHESNDAFQEVLDRPYAAAPGLTMRAGHSTLSEFAHWLRQGGE